MTTASSGCSAPQMLPFPARMGHTLFVPTTGTTVRFAEPIILGHLIEREREDEP